MQYTIRNIPKTVDVALWRRAKRQGRTLNEIAVEAMTEALGLLPESPPSTLTPPEPTYQCERVPLRRSRAH
jgi:hypothetical protein